MRGVRVGHGVRGHVTVSCPLARYLAAHLVQSLHLDEVSGLVLAEDGAEAAEVVVVRLHRVLHLLHLLRADLGRRLHVGERRAQRVERLPQQLAVHAAHLPAERRLQMWGMRGVRYGVT